MQITAVVRSVAQTQRAVFGIILFKFTWVKFVKLIDHLSIFRHRTRINQSTTSEVFPGHQALALSNQL